MAIELLDIMVSLYRHNGMQVLLFQDIDNEIMKIDFGFRRKMTKNYDYSIIARNLEQRLEKEVCYLYEDDLGLYYSFFRFSDEFQRELNCKILCLGPFLFQPVTSQAFTELMNKKSIPPSFHQDFMEYFNLVPLIPSADSWNHMLAFFLSQLCTSTIKFCSAQDNAFALFSSSYEDYSIPEMPDVALEAIQKRYEYEEEIMKAVAAGDVTQASKAHHYFLQYRLLPRVSDPIRDLKNLLITFNTLLRKAAQNGQVHPLHIDNLSRQFAIQIESAFTVEQLENLSDIMIRKYCMLVKNYSHREYASVVQTCMDYIDFHYTQELSLKDLAAMCYVSSSHLSSLFKKETGMNIIDYINNTRIRQSLILLNTTNLPISDIAIRCGFTDGNYYSRIFKKYQGQSPKRYRESIRNS